MQPTLEDIMIYMQKTADNINSLESYYNLNQTDSSNLNTVKVGQTLSRLSSQHFSVLKKIRDVNGEARYEHSDVDPRILDTILIWFKFSFEQSGSKIIVRNHSDGSTFIANSMTGARKYIRDYF